MAPNEQTKTRWELLYRIASSPPHWWRIYRNVHTVWRRMWYHTLPEDLLRHAVTIGIENATYSLASGDRTLCPNQCPPLDYRSCATVKCLLLECLLCECTKAALSYLSNELLPHYPRNHYDVDIQCSLTCLPTAEHDVDNSIVREALRTIGKLDEYIVVEYCNGASFREISLSVGMSLEAVRKRYYRSIAKLRRLLGVPPPRMAMLQTSMKMRPLDMLQHSHPLQGCL